MTVILLVALVFLILVSTFFSGSETSMMALNRYRLRHLARAGHPGAKRAQSLLRRPDRLLGIILIGNTFSNIVASSITTILATRYFGELGVAACTVLLTALILIFGEVMPKTMAAYYPETMAFPASLLLKFLLRLAYPLVWVINGVSNSLLKPFGIHVSAKKAAEALSAEELRGVVHDSGSKLASRHRNMLLGVLDLEKATISDVMVPRHKIIGLDLNQDLRHILKQLRTSPYSRLPVYRDTLDQIIGILPLRKLSLLLEKNSLNKQELEQLIEPAYFIPENTTLHRQLAHFQKNTEQLALVVDEYGDIQGLATVADILEEIVGEFISDQPASRHAIHTQADGAYVVSASITVRELNRKLHLELPTSAKTLGGLITEYLQDIPAPEVSMLINGYPIEILKVEGNAVVKVRIYPRIVSADSEDSKDHSAHFAMD